MFTGIVTNVGKVVLADSAPKVVRLGIESDYDVATIEIGASIAHDGCCLTVVRASGEGQRTLHFVDVAAETLAKTTLGSWQVGRFVNLERSLRVGDELGGHLVQGHVDGLGEVTDVHVYPDAGQKMRFRAPEELAPLIAQKGSIAIDGVSLTVNEVEGATFEVMIVPHTLLATTLGNLKAGDKVNLEADALARYAQRILATRSNI
ncbi:MAG: riboflavin synthase [Hyphomonadaceae bacterium]